MPQRTCFRIEIPLELIDQIDLGPRLRGFTGELAVHRDHAGFFERNTFLLTGTHDSADVGSQAAVARVMEVVRRHAA
jgi:hypothetical protein